jgi:hypothetical protein
MRALALLHRWAGGVIGLFLAILGLSGAILALEESWIGVAHAGDPSRRIPVRWRTPSKPPWRRATDYRGSPSPARISASIRPSTAVAAGPI